MKNILNERELFFKFLEELKEKAKKKGLTIYDIIIKSRDMGKFECDIKHPPYGHKYGKPNLNMIQELFNSNEFRLWYKNFHVKNINIRMVIHSVIRFHFTLEVDSIVINNRKKTYLKETDVINFTKELEELLYKESYKPSYSSNVATRVRNNISKLKFNNFRLDTYGWTFELTVPHDFDVVDFLYYCDYDDLYDKYGINTLSYNKNKDFEPTYSFRIIELAKV